MSRFAYQLCSSLLPVSRSMVAWPFIIDKSCAWHVPHKQLAYFNTVAAAKYGQSHGFRTHAAATADAVAPLPFTSYTLLVDLWCSFVHGTAGPVRALACCSSRMLSAQSAFPCCSHILHVINRKSATTPPAVKLA